MHIVCSVLLPLSLLHAESAQWVYKDDGVLITDQAGLVSFEH
jgi:hypothetical protein